MRKESIYVLIGGLFLVIGISLSPYAQAQTPSFPYCADTPKCAQTKVAQVPLPWQFWGIITDSTGTKVIDRIRISPTWLNPLPDQPAGTGPVFVRRQFALVPSGQEPLPLEALLWNFDTNMPEPDLVWMPVRDDMQMPSRLDPQEDLELVIPVEEDTRAVLVAYEVIQMTEAGEELVMGHIINEAILEANSPQTIVQIRVNMDIHNGTGGPVTNFELDFLGLDFQCDDVLWALGFVVDTGELWGGTEKDPLVVRPIDDRGTEVKWVRIDRPLKDSEWLHIGLVFDCSNFDCFNPDPTIPNALRATVQGYWTVSDCPPEVSCIETVNPAGKTIPPAGKTTLPGPKGGQNEDGFYKLFAKDDKDPKPQIWVSDLNGSGPFGPFSSGDNVKITEAPGGVPGMKKMGSTKGQAGAITAHITLTGDAIVTALDAAGNSASATCLVPPPPK